MVGGGDANLKSSGGLVGAQAASHCLPLGIGLHGQQVRAVGEHAARAGIRQKKSHGGARYRFTILMEDLDLGSFARRSLILLMAPWPS